MKNAEQGGDSIVHASASNDVESWKGGDYVENSHLARSSAFSHKLEAQTKLWRKSLTLLNLQDF